MPHRIARLVEPLRQLLRRPGRDSSVHGPTVRHVGFQPRHTARPVAVPGIGLGALGMPTVVVGGTR